MDCIKIERVANGTKVSLRDPEIEKANHKSDGPWRSPEVDYVFEDEEKMLKFVSKALKKLDTGNAYETAFNKAMSEEIE